jgi:hypothetical protein
MNTCSARALVGVLVVAVACTLPHHAAGQASADLSGMNQVKSRQCVLQTRSQGRVLNRPRGGGRAAAIAVVGRSNERLLRILHRNLPHL